MNRRHEERTRAQRFAQGAAERAVEENRRDPRTGKNAPSRAADGKRPVVETRGDRRRQP